MDSGLGLYQADEKVIEERIEDCIDMVRLGMASGESPAGELAAKSMEHGA
jgi:hypothetical protein